MVHSIKKTILTLALALMTLGANAALHGDVNFDGEVNIADINAVIDLMLS